MNNNQDSKVCALMPMKDHSERLPNKNVLLLDGKPLFYHMVNALQQAKHVDKVVINTDSERIIALLKKDFPEVVIVNRPAHLIGDEVSMNSLIDYDINLIDGEHFLQTHSTNPLVRAATIDRAIERYFEGFEEGYDTLNAVTRYQTRFFNSRFEPINHDPDGSLQTQLLTPVFEDNSNFYIFSRKSFSRTKKRIGERCFYFEVDKLESVDIDDASDFFMAEAIYRARKQAEAEQRIHTTETFGGVTLQNVSFGGWITRPDEAIAEIMARSGLFSWIGIDMEHTTLSISEAGKLIRIIDLCGVEPYVRLSINDPVQTKRVLDAGARGIIVPMVKSREDAIAAMKSCYYPVSGERGVGLGRAHAYGIGFEKYLKEAEPFTKIIIQIEHIDAVEKIDSIFSVDGIYAYIIGPYDLSGSLGKPGEFDCPEMSEAINSVMESAVRHNIIPGYHVIEPDIDNVFNMAEKGYKLIAISFDTMIFAREFNKMTKNLEERGLIKKK